MFAVGSCSFWTSTKEVVSCRVRGRAASALSKECAESEVRSSGVNEVGRPRGFLIPLSRLSTVVLVDTGLPGLNAIQTSRAFL